MEPAKLREWIESAGELRFVRSGGPGGQNVNKVNTKATLRLPITSDGPFAPEELELIRSRLANRINTDNELVIHSQRTRSQSTNRDLALDKAEQLLRSALRRKPRRKKTRPGKAAKERRLNEKRLQGRKKRRRGQVGPEE